MVVFEKLLINSGQFARNILAFLSIIVTGAGMFLSIKIFDVAFNLGTGQPMPDFVQHYVYPVGIVPALVTLVLCFRDMKKQ